VRSFATNFERESAFGKCFLTSSRKCVAAPLSPAASILTVPALGQLRRAARLTNALTAAPSRRCSL
jgi:hypothetical protein